jgi:hypothetical protein
MKSKKHCDFVRTDKVESKMGAWEAYRGGSRRQPHTRSSQPAVSMDGPLTGMAHDVPAPAVEIIPGDEARGIIPSAEARGLTKCDGLRRHYRR